mgnify:CR=1 FL=1
MFGVEPAVMGIKIMSVMNQQLAFYRQRQCRLGPIDAGLDGDLGAGFRRLLWNAEAELVGEPMQLDPAAFIFKQLRLEGFWLSRQNAIPHERSRVLLAEIMKLTDELPSPADIERVRAKLAAHGWPLDDPRDSDFLRDIEDTG